MMPESYVKLMMPESYVVFFNGKLKIENDISLGSDNIISRQNHVKYISKNFIRDESKVKTVF